MMTDEELAARLERADPGREQRASRATLDTLVRESEVAAPGRRRFPRLAVILGGLGVMLLGAGVAAPVAADAIREFLAQTGTTCGAGTECNPDDEWIDTSAPDLAEYAGSVIPSLPLPDPMTSDDLVRAVDAQLSANPGMQTETGIQRTFETIAYCAWVERWLELDDRGDVEGRTAAGVILQEAATWPAIVATDGGGIVDMLQAFGDLAAEGSRDAVQATAQMNACEAWDGKPRGAFISEVLG